MKNFPLVCACAAVAAVSVPTSASAQVARGDAALASLEGWSTDGCEHTVAELVLIETRGGELESGLYLTGSRENVCTGAGMGFATYADVTPRLFGLMYGRYQGTVVAESYSGGEPVTFEIDLTWLGRGKVTAERNSDGESGASFAVSLRRDALTRGSVHADGLAMTVVSAMLASETSSSVAR